MNMNLEGKKKNVSMKAAKIKFRESFTTVLRMPKQKYSASFYQIFFTLDNGYRSASKFVQSQEDS